VILGPLYRVELLRLIRRGMQYRLRVSLSLFLLVGLFSAYLMTFPGTKIGDLLFFGTSHQRAQLNQFGENFLIAFLAVQQLVIVLITPVFAGGAFADEKQRGSYDFLLMTPLSRWELVAGKLAARFTFVLAVLITGMPVLFLTLLFGGVSFERVLAVYTVAFATVFAVGTFAAMLSMSRHTLRDVLIWSYLSIGLLTMTTAILGACVGGLVAQSPFGIVYALFRGWNDDRLVDPTWMNVLLYSASCSISGTCFFIQALRWVRRSNQQPNQLHVSTEEATFAEPTPTPFPNEPATDDPPLPDWYQVPNRDPVDDSEEELYSEGRMFAVRKLGDDENPFNWKEYYFSNRLPFLESTWLLFIVSLLTMAFLFVLCAGLFVAVSSQLARGEWPDESIHICSRIFLVTSVFALPILGLRTTFSIANERVKLTLHSLLMLAVPRDTILWAKIHAALVQSKWLLVSVGGVLGFAVLTGGIHPMGAAASVLLLIGFCAFVTMLGIFLSIICSTPIRAVMFFLAIVVAVMILPAGLNSLFRSTFSGHELSDWTENICPQLAVKNATANDILSPFDVIPTRDPRWAIRWRTLFVGVGYGCAAGLLWLAARWRFEQDGKL
jgi:ABC-type transport system involved in multi-copper enzyme maturation permease subunit